MKIALLIAGHLRTFERLSKDYERLFSHKECDVFIETYDTLYGYHPVNRSRLGNISEVEITQAWVKDVLGFFNIISLSINNEANLKHEVEIPNWMQGAQIHSNSFYPLILFQRLTTRMRNQEEKSGIEYDLVIKLRPDLKLRKDIFNITPGNDTIYLQVGNVQPNDWIIIGNSTSLKRLSDALIKEVYCPSSTASKKAPPHGFYRSACHTAGLSFEARSLAKGILRANGVLEWTLFWRIKNKLRIMLGLLISKIKGLKI